MVPFSATQYTCFTFYTPNETLNFPQVAQKALSKEENRMKRDDRAKSRRYVKANEEQHTRNVKYKEVRESTVKVSNV